MWSEIQYCQSSTSSIIKSIDSFECCYGSQKRYNDREIVSAISICNRFCSKAFTDQERILNRVIYEGNSLVIANDIPKAITCNDLHMNPRIS